jgi:LCP family protein required for cell wall assembly
MYAGQRGRAYQLFAIDGLILVTAVVAVGWHSLELIKLWVSPGALLVLMTANVVLLAFRAMASINAFLAEGFERKTGVEQSVGVALAAMIVVVPHLLVGYLAYTQYDLIEAVFADPDPVVVAADTTTTTEQSVTTVESTVESATTTIPATTTTTTVPVLWDGLDRLNIVLLGADAGEGRRGLRTDTTIVVSVDPLSGQTVMLSVPRDLSNAPLPKEMGRWGCDCFPDLITHLYDAGVRYPEAFPGPGEPPINAIKGALSEIFGIPIHYYAMVTLDGFVGIVDALGGVTIDVPRTIVDDQYPHENGSVERVVIEEGTQHLDGHHALAYARIRRQSDDFARMHRQRCVLGAVLEQTSPIDLIASFGQLAEAVKENVTTDIPQDRLVDFVDLLPRVSTERIATLRITRAEYKTGSAPGRVYYDIDRIRADANDLMTNPEQAMADQERLALDETCEGSFDP